MSVGFSDSQTFQNVVENVIRESSGWQFLSGGRQLPQIDCLGFVIEFYRRFGIHLPDIDSPTEYPKWAPMFKSVVKPKPGNIMLLDYTQNLHVGIALGRFDYIDFDVDGLNRRRFDVARKSNRILGVYDFVN